MPWREFDGGSCETDMTVEISAAMAQYHDVARVIDRHNRVRQYLLDLEKAIGAH